MSDERLLVVPYVPVMVLLGFSIIAGCAFMYEFKFAGHTYLSTRFYSGSPRSCQQLATFANSIDSLALWHYVILFHRFDISKSYFHKYGHSLTLLLPFDRQQHKCLPEDGAHQGDLLPSGLQHYKQAATATRNYRLNGRPEYR